MLRAADKHTLLLHHSLTSPHRRKMSALFGSLMTVFSDYCQEGRPNDESCVKHFTADGHISFSPNFPSHVSLLFPPALLFSPPPLPYPTLLSSYPFLPYSSLFLPFPSLLFSLPTLPSSALLSLLPFL